MAGAFPDAVPLPKVQVGSRVIKEAALRIQPGVLLIDDNMGGTTVIYYGDVESLYPDSPGFIFKKHVVRVRVKRRGWDAELYCNSREHAVDLSTKIKDAIAEYEQRRP